MSLGPDPTTTQSKSNLLKYRRKANLKDGINLVLARGKLVDSFCQVLLANRPGWVVKIFTEPLSKILSTDKSFKSYEISKM